MTDHEQSAHEKESYHELKDCDVKTERTQAQVLLFSFSELVVFN